MNRFLFGLATGIGASIVALVAIVGAYNPPLAAEFEGFANALGYYIVGLTLACLAALIVAMVRIGMFEVVFPRRRPAMPVEERDPLL